MTREQETFIKRFLEELEEENIAIFLGAGLSTSAGYVDWKELIKPFSEELHLDISKEHDYISIAQYYSNENGRNRTSQHIINEISQVKEPTANHRILAELPIKTFWTTNYDNLMEKALENEGKIVDKKYTINHLALTKKKRDVILYKMHGDIDNADDAVITKDDYEKYPIEMAPYVTALSGELVSKTFLFMGFSFADPNLDYIMSRVKIHFDGHERQHFCFFKEYSNSDFKNDSNSHESYINAKTKQVLLIKDLARFQIKTILVREYSEITEILLKIKRLYNRRTIFLSGSAYEFGKWSQSDVEVFLCKLGSILIEKKFKISSGLGLGIGNAFITGAIQSVYNYHNGHVSDYLNMKPFPQYISDDNERRMTWTKYRNEMIGSAGIALFFMGNKIKNGQLELADGIREEFEVAKKLGLIIIPIGCSGYMAKEIFDEIMVNPEGYYKENTALIDAIKNLGDTVEKPDQLFEKVITAIELAATE